MAHRQRNQHAGREPEPDDRVKDERDNKKEGRKLINAIGKSTSARLMRSWGGGSVRAVLILVCVSLGACSGVDRSPALTVAVATNFYDTAQVLAREFESSHGASVTLISGSTGKLYAQVVNGAPFDVFLAADESRPNLLEESGHAVGSSGFVYARGRLALWSPDPARIRGDGADILVRGEVRRLAIANPALAPYGAAARDVLERLQIWTRYADRLVMGENVGQAFALAATGNAELGFVALSSVLSPATMNRGSRWDVPPDMHAPISQRAVLLMHGAENQAAVDFVRFLQSNAARSLIQRAGYAVE